VTDDLAGAINPSVLLRAIDDAPDGIFVVDRDGAIVFANPRAESIFGYGIGELNGVNVDALVPDSVRPGHANLRAGYMANPHARPMGSSLDLRGRRADGEEFPVEISLSPVGADAEEGVIAIVRDVSARRKADEALQHAFSELALVDDRERIARDLHDTVIQRLFAIGLSLQAGLGRASDDGTRERLTQAIDEIDATIHDLRSAIFSLHARRATGTSTRDEVLALIDEMEPTLGFRPSVRFDGLVDAEITATIREQLLPSLRESLTNVAKHAHAARVEIAVTVGDDVVMTVRDNGVGGATARAGGHGVANIAERARSLGGTCDLDAPNGGGTLVTWRVPRDR
jgi:PAS domain S-box-containing protein